MFWAKRDFAYADYAKYFELLEKFLFADPGRYAEYIMVSTRTVDPAISTYYVGVPFVALLLGFDGFERVEETDLPKEIEAVLIADATKEPFKSRFKMGDYRRGPRG